MTNLFAKSYQFESFIFEPINKVLDEYVDFIISLRSSQHAKHLTKFHLTRGSQKDYLDEYLRRYTKRQEIYFIVKDAKSMSGLGCFRITELSSNTDFCYESLVMKREVDPGINIQVMIAIYFLGFEVFDRIFCRPFRVSVENTRVILLHQSLGLADVVAERDGFLYFCVRKTKYLERREWLDALGLRVMTGSVDNRHWKGCNC